MYYSKLVSTRILIRLRQLIFFFSAGRGLYGSDLGCGLKSSISTTLDPVSGLLIYPILFTQPLSLTLSLSLSPSLSLSLSFSLSLTLSLFQGSYFVVDPDEYPDEYTNSDTVTHPNPNQNSDTHTDEHKSQQRHKHQRRLAQIPNHRRKHP
jgi:hypothetical protein